MLNENEKKKKSFLRNAKANLNDVGPQEMSLVTVLVTVVKYPGEAFVQVFNETGNF